MRNSPRRCRAKASQTGSEFLDVVLTASNDGVLIVDATNSVLMVNDSFCKFFDWAPQDLIGSDLRHHHQQLDADMWSQWTDMVDRIRSDGAVSNVEFHLTRAGRVSTFCVNGRPLLHSPDGTAAGTVSVWREVTVHRKERDEVRAQKKETEIFRQMANGLIEYLDLELRNPLIEILELSDMVRDARLGSLNHQRYQKHISDIETAGTHIIKTIDSLRDGPPTNSTEISGGKIDNKLADLATDLVCVCSKGKIQRINRTGALLLGARAQEDLVGRSFSDYVHPEDFRRLLNELPAASSGALSSNMRFMRVGGDVIEVDVTAVLDGEPSDAVLLLSARDITERRQRETALRESEERFRKVFENSTFGMTLIGVDGRFLLANPSFCRMLGRSDSEMLSMTFFETIHPDDRPTGDDPTMDLCRQGENISRAKMRFLHKNGSSLWCDLTFSAIHNANGEQVYTLGQIEDISERLRLEEIVREHRQELAHVWRLNTMAEMFTTLAHELNQPLAAVVVYAQGLAKKISSENIDVGELEWPLEQIAVAAESASEILDHVRSLVRNKDPKWEEVDLGDLFRGATGPLMEIAAEQGINLRLRPQKDLPSVLADPILIEQVVLNLARNGSDAMQDIPQGSRVLTIDAVPTNNRSVKIIVSDTGRGIPGYLKERVFDPFFSTKENRAGMGLSICRSLIELHGGEIEVESDGVTGATFTFELPIDGKEPHHAR